MGKAEMSGSEDNPEINWLELESDVVELRNGLAAIKIIGLALEADAVGNDMIAARGIRFTEENMRSALDRLAKMVGLDEKDT